MVHGRLLTLNMLYGGENEKKTIEGIRERTE